MGVTIHSTAAQKITMDDIELTALIVLQDAKIRQHPTNHFDNSLLVWKKQLAGLQASDKNSQKVAVAAPRLLCGLKL
jgi:hypothetical protein